MASTIAKGYSAKAVLVPESVFMTLAGSGQVAFPFVSASETPEYTDIENQVRQGQGAAPQKPIADSELHRITVVSRFDYDNCNDFLYLASGDGDADISPVEENEKIYSLVLDKNVKRWQYLGGMCEELRIIGDVANSIIMLEADMIFAKLSVTDTAIPSDTLTSSTYLKMQHCTFRIGDVGDALASGDELKITNFMLRIKNNLRIQKQSASAYIMQPIRERERETTFEFTASRYESSDEISAIQTAMTNYSILQADLTITDGVGSNNVLIQLPEMYPLPGERVAPPVTGGEPLAYTARLKCCENDNNETHMASATEEYRITIAT